MGRPRRPTDSLDEAGGVSVSLIFSRRRLSPEKVLDCRRYALMGLGLDGKLGVFYRSADLEGEGQLAVF